MPRQKHDAHGTTWQDISECVPAWEREHHCRVSVQITWDGNLASRAYVEAVLRPLSPLDGHQELVRVRQAFPTTKAAGQAGAVLYCIFAAFQEMERNPWLWPEAKRKAAVSE